MLTIRNLKEKLAEGAYDAELAHLYCQSEDAMGPYRDRIAHVADGYVKTFGKNEDDSVAIFSAPGRTEIGGNHTDHQRGKVLTGSVNLDAIACAAPNGTSTVNVFSEGFGMTSIDISSLEIVPEEMNSTASLIRGILYAISDFDCFHDDTPY